MKMELVEENGDWNPSPRDWERAETAIAEHIFSTAVTKLRYLLPPEVVSGILQKKRQRTELGEHAVDSGILRDVLLREYQSKVSGKPDEEAPLSVQDQAVKAALQKLYLETISQELDEEVAKIGSQTLDLFLEVLDYLPHAPETAVSCLERSLHHWKEKQDNEDKAEHFDQTRQSNSQKNYDQTSAYIRDQTQQIEAFLVDLTYQTKLAETELNDLEARVSVEKEFIEESGKMAWDFEMWKNEQAEREAEKRETYARNVKKNTGSVYDEVGRIFGKVTGDLAVTQKSTAEKMQRAESELREQLDIRQAELENTQRRIRETECGISEMRREIEKWREEQAEQTARRVELAQYLNATIKIQRWWRWQMWKQEKFGKKKKRSKSKGKKNKK